MNYGTNEAVAITMTIAYDNANQVNAAGDVNGIGGLAGVTLARTIGTATGAGTAG
jgi:hypothetical protein